MKPLWDSVGYQGTTCGVVRFKNFCLQRVEQENSNFHNTVKLHHIFVDNEPCKLYIKSYSHNNRFICCLCAFKTKMKFEFGNAGKRWCSGHFTGIS